MSDRTRITAALALALGVPAAIAQSNTSDPVPSIATTPGVAANEAPQTASPGASAGVPPPAPPVLPQPTPSIATDIAGQEGFFRPSPTDAVVVPGFTPTTPGVTPMDAPTNATVGSSASDRALRDSVASALALDPALQGASLNVTVRNGVVNITGSARDRAQADRARALAEGAVGVARVSASISTGE